MCRSLCPDPRPYTSVDGGLDPSGELPVDGYYHYGLTIKNMLHFPSRSHPTLAFSGISYCWGNVAGKSRDVFWEMLLGKMSQKMWLGKVVGNCCREWLLENVLAFVFGINLSS